MTFSSGIKTYLDVNGIKDPAVAWAGLAAQDPDYTFVGTARGQPAALIDPLKDPAGTANGSVTVVDDGLWIVVEGNGKASISDLTRVTNSLSANG